MKYSLVIFDWDGTLMDSAAKIVNCMRHAAAQLGMRVPGEEDVRQIIGISLKPAIRQLFGIDDESLVERLVGHYKDTFLHHDQTPTPLFSGVQPMLSTLQQQGRTLAVATGKARLGLNRAWQLTDTGDFFHTSRCADEAKSKPHPDMLQQILDELNLSPQQAVMIGDTSYDMSMAEQLGMDRVAVSYGVHNEQQLRRHKPKAIVHSAEELLEHL